MSIVHSIKNSCTLKSRNDASWPLKWYCRSVPNSANNAKTVLTYCRQTGSHWKITEAMLWCQKEKTGIQVNLWYRTKARSRDKFTETNVLSIGKQQKNISNGYLYLLLTVSKHFRLTQKKRTLKKRKWECCFRPELNWRPSACEADVITTTLRKPRW